MKVPKRPPSFADNFAKIPSERMKQLLFEVNDVTVSGKYLHWEDVKYRTPPAGFTKEEWWYGLKMTRIGQGKPIPLIDTSYECFSFVLADPLPEALHRIDLLTGGTIKMPEQVTNEETKRGYLVRSLIEEATTSSQLEGAATTREVAREMIRQGRPARDQGERMILNNYRAMERIIETRAEPLTRDLIFELHRMVTEGTLKDPSAAGRFRRQDEPCVVGNDFDEVYHVPPPAGQLDVRLDAMIAFANGETPGPFIHPAIRSMILHFWLAYDHPFLDGNGRTARALFYWSMLRSQYWLFEYISISRIILKAPMRYGRAFLYTETDDNDLTYFLLYHSEVIGRAITELYEYLERRTKQVRSLETELRGMATLNHRQRELISHALRHPGFLYSVDSHRRSNGVVYQTARTDLLQLVERNLLDSRKVGKAWVFTPSANLEDKLRLPAD